MSFVLNKPGYRRCSRACDCDTGETGQIGKATDPADTKQSVLTEAEMVKLQRANTLTALQQCNWKIYGEGGAAELLGIKPTTLTTRIKMMKLAKPTS